MNRTGIRLLAMLCAGFIGSIAAAQAQQQHANLLLQDLSAELGGSSSVIKWTNLTAGNPNRTPHSQSTTTGSLTPIASGQYTAGLYNWMGDFGTVITADSPFAAKTVVLQTAWMPNPAFSLEEHFTYDHAAHYQPGDSYNGGTLGDPNGADSYNYIPELANMRNLMIDYSGGPLLKWTAADNTFGYLQAAGYGTLGDKIWLDIGAIAGFYYNFAWQWDLSAIPGDIVAVEVITPIPVHASTIGQQLTLGDTFNPLFEMAIPEPSFYAALLGLAGLGIVLRHRKAKAVLR